MQYLLEILRLSAAPCISFLPPNAFFQFTVVTSVVSVRGFLPVSGNLSLVSHLEEGGTKAYGRPKCMDRPY